MSLGYTCILRLVDELFIQATRALAAIRITVRKDPEVLAVQVRENVFADWLVVRMCFLLPHVKSIVTREEIIVNLAKVMNTWKESIPKRWHELRKCTETIKSYICCNNFFRIC
jgi:hypothetical protein